MTTATQKTTDLLVAVLADLAPVVGGITAGQLHDPTPCTELDVGQLRTHVLGWLTTFAGGFADPGGRAPLDRLDGYAVPADPAAEVSSAAATMAAALRDGAATRPLRLGDSAMPGDMALSMILWEYQVHGWDLARATGQPWSPPAEAAEESLEFAPGMLTDDYQGEGKAFAPRVRVPATAAPLDRLLGLSGRDPAWPAHPGGGTS
ncbi:MAG TPA: TIGR03086 family metal-binding protein [Streptosporangiaceae bacterium]